MPYRDYLTVFKSRHDRRPTDNGRLDLPITPYESHGSGVTLEADEPALQWFAQIRSGVQVDGPIPERFAQLRTTQSGESIVFSADTWEPTRMLAVELLAQPHVRRYYAASTVVERIRDAAERSVLEGTEASDALGQLNSDLAQTPGAIRFLLALRSRIHFEDEDFEIAGVRFYRGTEERLLTEVTPLSKHRERSREMFGRMVEGHLGKLVADLSVTAEPERARELAGERLRLAIAILGLGYVSFNRDFPTADAFPLEGVARLAVSEAGLSWTGHELFGDRPLMSFPRNYLLRWSRGAVASRLSRAVLDPQGDVDRRLLLALHWWAAGNEPGPWSVRLVKYLAAFEALFGRIGEKRGASLKVAQRVAAMVTGPGGKQKTAREDLRKLYRLRDLSLHQGEVSADAGEAYLAMRRGAMSMLYVARSLFVSDAELHGHLDKMVRAQESWIDYGWRNGLDQPEN